jgi:opacity protein-like surface antigen
VKRAILVLLACACALPAPAAAQDAPALALRPFALATEQSFAAIDTFDATFGHSTEPFFGGGVQLLIHDGIYVEFTASRFKKDGDRAFRSGGINYSLGIPLTATITPLELTGGYRFHFWPRVRPYVAGGIGSYGYTETSGFADPGDDVSVRHKGYLANAGAEFRLHRWVGLGVDVQYSHVPGILGQGGISQQTGENDLGGVAARFRLLVGR